MHTQRNITSKDKYVFALTMEGGFYTRLGYKLLRDEESNGGIQGEGGRPKSNSKRLAKREGQIKLYKRF